MSAVTSSTVPGVTVTTVVGGYTDKNVLGKGHKTWDAILDKDVMVYLACLSGPDVDQIAAFLDNPVTNNPPTAATSGPYNGTVGLSVILDGSPSSDSDGTIVAYGWDFGDGSTGTGRLSRACLVERGHVQREPDGNR